MDETKKHRLERRLIRWGTFLVLFGLVLMIASMWLGSYRTDTGALHPVVLTGGLLGVCFLCFGMGLSTHVFTTDKGVSKISDDIEAK